MLTLSQPWTLLGLFTAGHQFNVHVEINFLRETGDLRMVKSSIVLSTFLRLYER